MEAALRTVCEVVTETLGKIEFEDVRGLKEEKKQLLI